MRILSKLQQLSRRVKLVAGVTAAVVGASLFAGSVATAASNSCPAGFNGDGNAVIWCGAHTTGNNASPSEITDRYNHGDGHNSAASIHNIYGSSTYGITNNDIQDLSKDSQVGSVTKSGDVIVGGKVVATDANSAGRQNIPGSVRHSNNGTVYYVSPPSTSFLNNSLSAYVVMQNGQFKFAILEACGNPVSAHPKPAPKKPSYTINKEVAVKGSTAFAKSVTVKSGTHVIYRITVKSTGNTPVTNLMVNDALPKDAQYVSGTLQRDGKAADSNAFFGKGINISSLKDGSSTVFTFEAIIGPKDTVQTCQAETLNNVGHMTATSLPGESSTATVNKTCLPKPTFACTSLTDSANSRSEFTFTAKATANNGATIAAYNFDFGDGATKTVTTAAETTTAQHTYTTAGTFNANVSVTVNLGDGTTKTVTAPACAATVTVIPAPTAECTDLKLQQDQGNPRAVTATATIHTENGATLSGISFDWGDGTTTPSSTQTTANHTYQQDGTFTVKGTATFSAPSGTVPNSNCQAMITITTVVPVCNQLTLDINNDDKTVTVTSLTFTPNNGTYEFTALNWGDNSPAVTDSDITGQTHTYTTDGPFTVVATPHFLVNGVDTPVTAATCQQPVSFTETPTPPPTTPPTVPTPPTQLVNTGAGSVIGLFTAVTAIGFVAYRRFLSRRLGRDDS